jgi:hypothetical protein
MTSVCEEGATEKRTAQYIALEEPKHRDESRTNHTAYWRASACNVYQSNYIDQGLYLPDVRISNGRRTEYNHDTSMIQYIEQTIAGYTS